MRASVPYVASLVPLALTLAVHGTRALGYDGHPLQYWEGALLVWVGVEVFRRGELGDGERLLYASGAAWLCVDELLLVHECVKWRAGLGALGEPLVALYVLGGLAAGARVLARHPARRAAAPHAVVAAAAALVALGADLQRAVLLEETSELLAIAAALAVLRAAPRTSWVPAAGWVAFQAGWMALAIALVRPWLCPTRLL